LFHQYAAGLAWRHEDNEPSIKALRLLSAEKGQWGIVRKTKTKTVQVGFCQPIKGTSSASKVKALAAVIADQKQQPWMGTYQIDTNLFWYIAVRDDQEIIPGGDFIGSRDEVETLREQHLGYGEWNEVVTDGTVEDLADMAMAVPRPASLRDYQVKKLGKNAIIATVGFGLIAAIGGAWLAYDRHEAAEIQARQERDRKLAEQAARDSLSKQSKVLPWTTEPMPSIVFTACQQAWSAQPLASGGWTLQTWSCHVDAASTAISGYWQREGGVAANAPGSVTPDGEHSTSSLARPITFAGSSQLAYSEEQAKRAVWTLAQTYGIPLKFNAAPPAPPPLPGSDAAKQPIDPWTLADASFPVDAPPWSWLERPFDAVPGLRIRDVAWSAGSQAWTVSGVVYSFRGYVQPSIVQTSRTNVKASS
jgi:hypothetical protein